MRGLVHTTWGKPAPGGCLGRRARRDGASGVHMQFFSFLVCVCVCMCAAVCMRLRQAPVCVCVLRPTWFGRTAQVRA